MYLPFSSAGADWQREGTGCFSMPLRRVKKATLTAFEMHPQARLQDDFAWRVKMTPYMILLLTFLIPGEKLVPSA